MPLFVERVTLGSGNLQAQARDARYALAERLAEGDYATGHTASDQAETVLYRLAVSPGSRALHGMAARRGRLVRPLLGVTREEVRDYLRSRGLGWREDPSNADRRFARARVRDDLMKALRTIGPAPERTIAETARQLREEAEVLDDAVSAALERLGGGPAVSAPELLRERPAVRRLVLRRLAEQAGGELPAGATEEIFALGGRGSKSLDLGGGLRVVVEYGTLRFTRAPEAAAPDPVELPVPGHARFGDWEVEAAPRRRRRRQRDRRDLAADRAQLGGGRPHATRRRGWHEDPPGPLHRPQGAPCAAAHPARGGERRRGRLGRRRGRGRALRGVAGLRRRRPERHPAPSARPLTLTRVSRICYVDVTWRSTRN